MAYRLLFVCLGNICRSPAAENIMTHLVQQAGLGDQILCDSAGTAAYHTGEPPDRRMTAAAAKQGITLTGSARPFSAQDFQTFDLILAMDRDNYRDILGRDPQGKYRHSVKMMLDFRQNYTVTEVPDPYYGGSDGFDYVIELLTDACEGLLEHLCQEHKLTPNR
jgi:protein-tyrosine phosphatase